MSSASEHIVKLTYSFDEVAAATSLSVPTIKRLVRDNRIPSLKIGNRRLFYVRDIEAWMANQAAEWTEERRVEERTWRAS